MARKGKKIDVEALAPKIQEGLTQGKHSLAEANEKFPSIKTTRLDQGLLIEPADVPGTRGKAPKFVAIPNREEIIEPNTGRHFSDVDIISTHDQTLEIQAGHRCLRCREFHPTAFPPACDVCGYEMKDRQILEFAMEFEGDRHIGPAKPMKDFLDERDARIERRKFDKRILEGRSKQRGARAS